MTDSRAGAGVVPESKKGVKYTIHIWWGYVWQLPVAHAGTIWEQNK